jgi:hypothetical protein
MNRVRRSTNLTQATSSLMGGEDVQNQLTVSSKNMAPITLLHDIARHRQRFDHAVEFLSSHAK